MTRQTTEPLSLDLPEPHEGVIGVSRPEDPLLVSEQAAALVARLVGHLFSVAMVQAPRSQRLHQRMTVPRPGDQVVVFDSIGSRNADTRWRGVGYLVTHRAEWWTSHETWEQEKAEDGALTEADRLVEHDAWYVQYGPNLNDICRWTNCTVLAIPSEDRL